MVAAIWTLSSSNRSVSSRLLKPMTAVGRVHAVNAQIVKVSPEARIRYRSTLGRILLAASDSRPFEYQTQLSSSVSQWFRDLVRSEGYDAIWFSKAITALSLNWRDRQRTIVDGDDFDHVKEFYSLINSPWYGAKAANYINVLKLVLLEALLPRKFARVVRCSLEDRRRFPWKNVELFRMVPTFPTRESRKTKRHRQACCLWAHLPMRQTFRGCAGLSIMFGHKFI